MFLWTNIIETIPWMICCLFITINQCGGYSYETKYYDQKIDHFGYGNEDVFRQKYLVNKDFWSDENGTIFFYTGNEGDIEMFANNAGFMWENAEKFNAVLLFMEHRYYGDSMPFGNDSFETKENRGYLSTEQALADFAAFITHFKSSILKAEDTPVIAFGGSYGGMLSAWFRIKYPHIVHGAIAASAPVLKFTGMAECGKYSEIVTRSFNKHGPHCVKSIKRFWKALRNISKTESGAKWLLETFNPCEKINFTEIGHRLKRFATTVWSSMAMLNYPYPTEFVRPLPGDPVKKACANLTDETVPEKKLIKNIYHALSVFHNYTGDAKCLDMSHPLSKRITAKVWSYQTCTEMVMPQCRDSKTTMFEDEPWNLTNEIENCQETYDVTPDENKIAVMYGGRHILASSNIVFSNGDLDPWTGGGILKDLSPTLIGLLITDAAHHLDLRKSDPKDPKSVRKARETELKWISKWIKEAKHLGSTKKPINLEEYLDGDNIKEFLIGIDVLKMSTHLKLC